MSRRFLPIIMLIFLLSILVVRIDNVSAGTPLTLGAPYGFGSTWLDPHNTGSATVNRVAGTGFVKAQPASGQSSGYYSISAALLVTDSWIFTDPTQSSGTVEAKGTLQSIHISEPYSIPAYVRVYLAMLDLNPDGTIANVKVDQEFTTSSASSSTPFDGVMSWGWTQNHIYRAFVFVAAIGVSGTGPYSISAQSEADASFTLTSIIWSYPNDQFGASLAKVANLTATPLLANPGDKVIINGTNFHNTGPTTIQLLTPSGGLMENLTGQGGLDVGNGNFTTTVTMPPKSAFTAGSGSYLLRIVNATGPIDLVESFIFFPLNNPPASTLPPTLILPLLAGVALVPILLRRRRTKASLRSTEPGALGYQGIT